MEAQSSRGRAIFLFKFGVFCESLRHEHFKESLEGETFMSIKLDRMDLKIIEALQEDARLSSAELAERVALTASPCWRRVKRLEEEGVITGYHAEVDPARLGYKVMAFVHISLARKDAANVRAFEEAVAVIPQVIACYCVSGRYDHQLTVVARDLEEFGQFARDQLGALPGVAEVYSAFVMQNVKTRGRLLPPLAEVG
jgi:DNA-binding Lrp family transcriptional regulator